MKLYINYRELILNLRISTLIKKIKLLHNNKTIQKICLSLNLFLVLRAVQVKV